MTLWSFRKGTGIRQKRGSAALASFIGTALGGCWVPCPPLLPSDGIVDLRFVPLFQDTWQFSFIVRRGGWTPPPSAASSPGSALAFSFTAHSIQDDNDLSPGSFCAQANTGVRINEPKSFLAEGAWKRLQTIPRLPTALLQVQVEKHTHRKHWQKIVPLGQRYGLWLWLGLQTHQWLFFAVLPETAFAYICLCAQKTPLHKKGGVTNAWGKTVLELFLRWARPVWYQLTQMSSHFLHQEDRQNSYLKRERKNVQFHWKVISDRGTRKKHCANCGILCTTFLRILKSI